MDITLPERKKMKIKELKAGFAKYNPRLDLKPGDDEYEKIKDSILTFGLASGIVWNKRTNTLIGGHQRIKILDELKLNEVEVDIFDMDLAHETAFNLALNKATGGWEPVKLQDVIEKVNLEWPEMLEHTGFSEAEIHKILEGIIEEDTPVEFEEFDESIKTDFRCPKCGYEWSGKEK